MRIVVVGCGRMGSELVRALAMRGHTLAVVDEDRAAFARLGSSFKGKTVMGIGFDREVLLEAGIQSADGLAAVTGSDEVNVIVARLARQVFRVPRVVARVYDPRKAEIYRRLGLHTIAPIAWGVNRMAESLAFSELNVLCSMGDGQLEIVETETPARLEGRTVHDLTIPGQVHVTAIHRSGRTILPSPDTVLQAGDMLYIAALTMVIDRLKPMLGVM